MTGERETVRVPIESRSVLAGVVRAEGGRYPRAEAVGCRRIADVEVEVRRHVGIAVGTRYHAGRIAARAGAAPADERIAGRRRDAGGERDARAAGIRHLADAVGIDDAVDDDAIDD